VMMKYHPAEGGFNTSMNLTPAAELPGLAAGSTNTSSTAPVQVSLQGTIRGGHITGLGVAVWDFAQFLVLYYWAQRVLFSFCHPTWDGEEGTS
jgi:hypothetical protein